MSYHDRQFVELAYRLILGRPADPDGLAHHLDRLRRGVSRREVAFGLGNSSEAKENGFDSRLFRSYRWWRRLERLPFIGTFMLLLICLVRFKVVVSEFRRVQNAVCGGFTAPSR
jgi:hypothetical protein